MIGTSSQLTARPPNWLPLPEACLVKKPAEQVVDMNDLFPKGEVVKFYPNQGYGYIKDRNGNEIYFKLNELDLVGPKTDKTRIAVGSKVGYDVSVTSTGPHVRTLKIY